MRPTSIKLKNAFKFDYELDFVMPSTGLLLFTGPNGAGKSSLAIESISVCLWGKTLRGTRPWRGDSFGYIDITLDEPNIRVTRLSRGDGDRLTLTWNVIGQEPVKYETAKKAQAALEALIGPWDVWRRTAVLSSADAAHFSEATDGERKRFLEAVFGLEKFDPALKACRLDLVAAQNEEDNHVRTHAGAHNAIVVAEQSIAEAEASLAGIPDTNPSTVRAEKKKFQTSQETIGAELRAHNEKLATLARKVAEARASEIDATRALARVQGDQCGVCGQSVSVHVRHGFEETAIDAKRNAEDGARILAEEQAAAQADIAALQQALADVRAKLSALDAEEQSSARTWGERARLQKLIETRCKTVVDQTVIKDLASQAVADAQARLAVLTAAETVLGLRGVRAHLLGRALRGIESVAATYLRELSDKPIYVSLPMKDDKIGLDVEGAGGGEGYKGCSTGERRRIDAAIVFALAEVAGAATGRLPDFLMFDELFDGLDESGRSRAAEILRKLARDRLIFVVSHRPDLAAQLSPTLHVRIDEGAVAA